MYEVKKRDKGEGEEGMTGKGAEARGINMVFK